MSVLGAAAEHCVIRSSLPSALGTRPPSVVSSWTAPSSAAALCVSLNGRAVLQQRAQDGKALVDVAKEAGHPEVYRRAAVRRCGHTPGHLRFCSQACVQLAVAIRDGTVREIPQLLADIADLSSAVQVPRVCRFRCQRQCSVSVRRTAVLSAA
jgi:hypothetical protein